MNLGDQENHKKCFINAHTSITHISTFLMQFKFLLNLLLIYNFNIFML